MALSRTVVMVCMTVVVVATSTTTEKRNVLMLVADDMRPEIGCFGADHMYTPNMDALAKESLVMTRNYVQQAVCGPTRASFLTGRRPNTLHTVTHTKPTYWRERAGNFSTIPQMFKEAGWYALSFGKVFDLRTSSYNTKDDTICDGHISWNEPPIFCGTKLWNLDHEMGRGQSHATLSIEDNDNMGDHQIAEAAVARLNGSTGTLPSPWFVAVGVHRPHLPLIVGQKHLDLYPLENVTLPKENVRHSPVNMPLAASECAGGLVPVPGLSSFELWQQYSYNTSIKDWGDWEGGLNQTMSTLWEKTLKRYYHAAVSHTDDMFGLVIDAVKARGDYDNTVVVVIGDHGWHLSENGMWCKCTNFESATRAPMMLRAPGFTDHGMVTTALTEHVDLMPSVAMAAGLGVVPTCPVDSSYVKLCTEGTNVLPLATSPTAVVKKASYSQWPHPFAAQQPESMGYTIRTATARYTEWIFMNYTVNGTFIEDWSRRCAREFYNYTVDPLEAVNIAEFPSAADVVAMYARMLRAGWRVAKGAAPWPNLPAPENQTVVATCPLKNTPTPSPLPPAPPGPIPPNVHQGVARHCKNITAQRNGKDTSCWVQPSNLPIHNGMRSWNDCMVLCAGETVCKAWTFDTKTGCFRHSANDTIAFPVRKDPSTVFSGCEHSECPTTTTNN